VLALLSKLWLHLEACNATSYHLLLNQTAFGFSLSLVPVSLRPTQTTDLQQNELLSPTIDWFATCTYILRLVLVCFGRKVLLAGCWWLICSERKVLLAGWWLISQANRAQSSLIKDVGAGSADVALTNRRTFTELNKYILAGPACM
jgi:hypothetical protein